MHASASVPAWGRTQAWSSHPQREAHPGLQRAMTLPSKPHLQCGMVRAFSINFILSRSWRQGRARHSCTTNYISLQEKWGRQGGSAGASAWGASVALGVTHHGAPGGRPRDHLLSLGAPLRPQALASVRSWAAASSQESLYLELVSAISAVAQQGSPVLCHTQSPKACGEMRSAHLQTCLGSGWESWTTSNSSKAVRMWLP